MARHAEFSTRVGDGANARSVGYSSTDRDGFLGVRFVDANGKRVEKMTRCKRRGKTPGPDYHDEATKLIETAYAEIYETPASAKAKWETTLDEVERLCTQKPETLRAMKTAVERFRELVPNVESPADVTPDIANRFALLLLATPYSRGKSTVERKRTPATLSYYRRSLSALWKRLRKLAHVQGNPWTGVEVPKGEKKLPYVPTAEEMQKFFAYIHTRYPHWERLHALLHLKLHSASRTADISQLKTAQIANQRFVFEAKQTKTKTERVVPLPKDLFDTLRRIAGKEWLWDGWNDDLRKFRPGRNPIPETFQAETVQCVLENIFREYSDSHPDIPRLSPHDFRRRAITSMVEITGSVDAAAELLGVTVQTIRNNYLDPKQAFETNDAFDRLASHHAHTIPTLSRHNGEQSGTTKNNG